MCQMMIVEMHDTSSRNPQSGRCDATSNKSSSFTLFARRLARNPPQLLAFDIGHYCSRSQCYRETTEVLQG
jgi:hypothetical protein